MVTALARFGGADGTGTGAARPPVTNGSTPYLGDGHMLTTVSPNRDGFRDEAVVHFRLLRPATVRLEVVATNIVSAGKGGTTTVWKTARHFAAGAGELTWRPAPTTQPRTYVLRLKVGERVYPAAPARVDARTHRLSVSRASMRASRSEATHRESRPSSNSRPTHGCCGCRSSPTSLRAGRASRTSRPAGSPRPDRFASTGAHTVTNRRCSGSSARRRPAGSAPARDRGGGGRVAPYRAAAQSWATNRVAVVLASTWPRTTSPTATATVGATPGMSPGDTAAWICAGRSSTSACHSASTTGIWSSSRGSTGRAGRWTSSRTTIWVPSVTGSRWRRATTLSSSPDTRNTSRHTSTT